MILDDEQADVKPAPAQTGQPLSELGIDEHILQFCNIANIHIESQFLESGLKVEEQSRFVELAEERMASNARPGGPAATGKEYKRIVNDQAGANLSRLSLLAWKQRWQLALSVLPAAAAALDNLPARLLQRKIRIC